jgi:hypothetical protein
MPKAKATQPTVTREINHRPFTDVEFDHSVADIAIIDDGSRIAEVIMRPVVTIAIDRATRTILGIGIAQFPIVALKNRIDDMTRRDLGSDK